MLIILLCIFKFPFAQNKSGGIPDESYEAVNWNYTNGLFYGRTTCFLKDAQGFLWVGTTNGLNRFDGNHFKNYLKNQKGNAFILDNHIYSLVEDSLHNIWVGTDKGVSRYDIREDRFTDFLPDVSPRHGSQAIIPYWSTGDEVYSIESDSLFTSYNIHTLKKKKWAALSSRLAFNSTVQQSVLDPSSGSVWLLPAGGSLMATSGLFRFYLHSGKLERYDWTCFLHIPGHNHYSEGMCYDRKRNVVWINSPDGLIRFSLTDLQFNYSKTLNPEEGRGIGIQVDSQDRIWMGTDQGGIVVYDPKTGFVNRPFKEDSVQQKILNNKNYRIYCDNIGIVWIGYWPEFPKGIYQLVPRSKSVTQYPAGTGKPHSLSSSYGILLARSGSKIWVFAAPGLNIFDPATGEFQLIEARDLKGIPHNQGADFLSIGRSPGSFLLTLFKDGRLYESDAVRKICLPLPVLDDKGKEIRNIQFESGPALNKNNMILLVGEGDHHIYQLKKDSAVAHELFFFPDRKIRRLFTAGENYLFVQFKDSLSRTYREYDGKWDLVSTPIDSIQWNNIVYNPTDRSWWVGCYGQILHYDSYFRLIRRFGREDGVPIINVWGIKPDQEGNIWFNTEISIAKITAGTEKITILSEKDGWAHQGFKLGANEIVNDSAGDLYLFGYNGLDRINPHMITSSYPPSSVYFKSLEVNQEKIPLSTGINHLEKIALAYSDNNISIGTGTIDYFSKGTGQIRYKLGGLSSWQYASADFTIHYEGLAPGNYTLFIQASNNANDFNGPEKRLDIHIRSPWWRTDWAYLAFGSLLLFSIWLAFWYRSKTLKARNAMLEKKIGQRTRELHDSMAVLKETQEQLVQKEKMASLGELTAGIAHEIQNPLNFVNNFSEVSTELMEELQEEEIKPDRDPVAVKELLESINQNLKKITHHGKRADAIVKGMLQHSRITSGKKELIDVNSLIQEYIHLAYNGLRVKIPNFQSGIQKQLEEGLGKIYISTEDIGRVLLNLLNNAFYAVNEKRIKLGADYQPLVTVSTKKVNQVKTGSEWIEIRVRDNGSGIDPKIMNKIYQPFFTTKPTGEGTGLGLSLSFEIVTKAYGGELTVQSEPGEYAEFIISLPVQAVSGS